MQQFLKARQNLVSTQLLTEQFIEQGLKSEALFCVNQYDWLGISLLAQVDGCEESGKTATENYCLMS
jgi:hypothetical protein